MPITLDEIVELGRYIDDVIDICKQLPTLDAESGADLRYERDQLALTVMWLEVGVKKPALQPALQEITDKLQELTSILSIKAPFSERN